MPSKAAANVSPVNSSLVRQIKASAGSGKTHTIINTLLNLFSQNNADIKQAFSSILAITFTNAAASDMKSKLIARLKNIALNLSENDPDIQMKKDEAIRCINGFIANYSALNIRTIDSFLFMLLRQNTLNLHIPPNVEPLFDSTEFFTPLLDELALASLHKDLELDIDSVNQETASLLKPMYIEMYTSLFYSEPQKGFLGLANIRNKIFQTISALQSVSFEQRDSITSYTKLQTEFEKSFALLRKKVNALDTLIDDNELETLAPYRAALADLSSSKNVPSFFLNDVNTLYNAVFKKSCIKKLSQDENKSIVTKINSALNDIVKVVELPYLLSSAVKYAPVVDFCKLILEMQSYEEFNKGRILSERIPAVLKELIESDEAALPQILQQLPYELDSVLIDEFQDTSTIQWDVIRAFSEDTLSRGGSLTYVGDVKQAIYSWRGGNSFLFDGILNELKSEIERKNLDTNWRSSKEVIEFNNTLFGQFKDSNFAAYIISTLMDGEYEEEFVNEITSLFDDVSQKVSDANLNSLYGRVALYDISVPPSGSGRVTNEALYGVMKERLCMAIAESHKRYNYKDMAILVRNNTHCAECARWLTEEKIPVITEGALNLAGNTIISQCISMLEYLKDTTNEASLWHISAFEGLFTSENLICEEKLLKFRVSNSPNSYIFNEKIRQKMGNTIELCLEENSPLISSQLGKYRSASQTISVYNLLCMIIEDCNLFERFKQQSGFFTCLLELALKAQKNGISTLHSFLEYWHEKGHEEKIPMPEGIDAVRILTIHKSKGAEFNVCFVWNEIDKPKKPKELKFYSKDKLSFFANHSPLHPDYAKALKIQALEAINLLYVAFTRAKNELYILYRQTKESNSILELILAKSLATAKEDKKSKSLLYSKSELAVLNKQEQKNALNSNNLPVLHFREPKLNYEELQESLDSSLTANMRGKIIHSCFEHYFKLCQLDRNCDKKIISMILAENLLQSEEKAALQQDIEKAFNWMKSLTEFDDWLQHEILSEQNIVDKYKNNLRCDLCLIGDQHIHIIDFKSGNTNKKYEEQLLQYIKALKDMEKYKHFKVSASLLYLDQQINQTIKCEG